jgi:hypothetical protein
MYMNTNSYWRIKKNEQVFLRQYNVFIEERVHFEGEINNDI